MEHFEFDPEHTVLGTVFTHAGEEKFALTELDRLNHMLVIGKTGMGKTQLLRNIILQDIYAGRGVGVIDPHGDLQHDLLDEYPTWRARHLVYLDPNDPERVVTFNVLADIPPQRVAAATAEIVGACKAVWGEIGWGARMERILYFALAALIEARNTSVLGLPRILKDERYRLDILDRVHNPIIHGFFADEYAVWDDDYRATAIEPVLNKIEQLLAAPAVCAMLGSISPSIDLREIMDERKVLICNLAKGNLGAGHVSLIGAMLVSSLSNAAARRGAETTDQQLRSARVPFHLHVDEVENFVTDAFVDILSEARKWKLSLLLAHQFRQQLPPKLRAAVLASVGSIVAFQTMGDDADDLAREMGINNPDLLTQLRRGEVWAKHATYGGPYHPYLLPPIRTEAHGRDAALNENKRRHTFPRARVEAKIRRFLSASSHNP